MPGIMSDNDVKGYFGILLTICNSEPWRDIWKELQFDVIKFGDIGLPDNAIDSQIWHACQTGNIVLITGNRNAEHADSIEATIREHNQIDSLPVLTLSKAGRIGRDRGYAELVVERLLETLIDLDEVRGAGRLYLP